MKQLLLIFSISFLNLSLVQSQSFSFNPSIGTWKSSRNDLGCNKGNIIEARIIRKIIPDQISGRIQLFFEVRMGSGSKFKENGTIIIHPIRDDHCKGSIQSIVVSNVSYTNFRSGTATVQCNVINALINPCQTLRFYVYQSSGSVDSLFPPQNDFTYVGTFDVRNDSKFSISAIPTQPVSSVGATISIRVGSCDNWRAEENQDWLSVSPATTANDALQTTPVQITLLPNATPKIRSGTIVFRTSTASKNIVISQEAGGFNCDVPNIASNNTVRGSTTNATNNVSSYLVNNVSFSDFSGKEKVYKYQHTGGRLNVRLSNAGANLRVIVLRNCDPQTGVLIGRNDELTSGTFPSGRYIIVVDGVNRAQGSFSLLVSSGL